MMSLYDVTESANVNTVPKDRRNGARYGQAACVCVVSAGDNHQTIMENERFLITIYVFLFALVLKYYSMNQKYLNNLYKRSMDVFFLLSHD